MHENHLVVAGDVFSLAAIAGAMAGYLPDIAAGVAALWYALHIYDWLRGKTG